MKIEFTIPMTKDLIVSEGNRSNENRFVKQKRHNTQKFFITAYCNTKIPKDFTLPCSIKMIRIAPRELDEEDNLRMAFKYIKDYIADFLIPGLAKGRADGDKRIKWEYGQEKGSPGQYAVRVEILS